MNPIIRITHSVAKHSPIFYAIKDLAHDIFRVSNTHAEIQADTTAFLPPQTISIFDCSNEADYSRLQKSSYIGEYISSVNSVKKGYEQYGIISTPHDSYIIMGSDERGVIWGIYHFCEEVLGVDPMYFWTDSPVNELTQKKITRYEYFSPPPAIKFRGWFINDEDLFTKWLPGCGTRNANYTFYREVINFDIIDRIIETALRLKINLLIPASLLDIMNPPEEELVKRVTRRGMFVSQHHIEPLGVSHFSYDTYWKSKNKKSRPSFVTNKEDMIQIWKEYVHRFAQYPNVIWQLGLRGRGDKPVWEHDAAIPQSMHARGRIISEAIQTQYDIIKNEVGHENFYTTSTLWMEGAALMNTGDLVFPERTIPVFSDKGTTQLFQEDFYTTKRKNNIEYGTYLHTAFWSDGPHLVRGTSLEKLYYNYQQIFEKKDSAYTILNVSNIREFSPAIEFSARISFNGITHTPASFRSAWCEKQFGKPELAQLMKKFFSCYQVLNNQPIADAQLYMDGMVVKTIKNILTRIESSEIVDSKLLEERLPVKSDVEYLHAIEVWSKAGVENFKSYTTETQSILKDIPEGRKEFFQYFFIVQPNIMYYLHEILYAMVITLGADNIQACVHYLNGASSLLSALKQELQKGEYGKWKNWYRGEDKMNIRGIQERVDALLRKKQNNT